MNTVRRKLELHNLNEVRLELDAISESGYNMVGNWTLGQICRHLMLDLRSSMDGYPAFTYFFAPLRPLIRKFLLPKILRFDSPVGIRTMGKFVPPAELDDRTELQRYQDQIQRFLTCVGPFKTHPGFGFNDRENLSGYTRLMPPIT